LVLAVVYLPARSSAILEASPAYFVTAYLADESSSSALVTASAPVFATIAAAAA
jgi:hypothetical protein